MKFVRKGSRPSSRKKIFGVSYDMMFIVIMRRHHSAPSPSIRFLIFAANWPVWPKAPALIGDIFLALTLSQFKCWPTLPWYFYRPLSQLTQVHCFFTSKASSSWAKLWRYPTTDCTLLSRTKIFLRSSFISLWVRLFVRLCPGWALSLTTFLRSLLRSPWRYHEKL